MLILTLLGIAIVTCVILAIVTNRPKPTTWHRVVSMAMHRGNKTEGWPYDD